jgi:type VI secretion system Hcp family effector
MVAVCGGSAGADTFLKMKGVAGDAYQRGFEQQILLTGASLSVSSMPDFGPDGEVLPTRTRSSGPIFLSKAPDRSSPRLMQAALEGKDVGTLEITFTAPGKNGSPQTPQYKWILEGVHLNSYSVSPGASVGDASSEMIEVSYESMRYQYFTIDPKTGRPASTDEVNFVAPVDHPFGLHDGDCG